MNRRTVLRSSLGVLPVLAGAPPNPAQAAAAPSAERGFPVYNVLDSGVKPDGATLNTEALQQTILRTSQHGGGVVYFPPGDYLTGTLEIKDRVTLYLEAGATIHGSKERQDYQHGCLIYADGASDAGIRGRGAIDGNGSAFWKREGGRWRIGGWRPGNMMQFVRCQNFMLEDVTLRNSPAWTVHPIDCDRLTIRGISILNGLDADTHGPNTDGIDPDGCTRVRISDCYIQSGDDSIVLKITNRSANRVCRDITVTNCVLVTRETALKIGSETYGEFHNINFSNCAVRDAGCGVGLWMRDGGVIDGWTVNNISMTLTEGGQPIYMTSYPRSRLSEPGSRPEEERPPGTVRSIMISNVTANADGGIFLLGMQEKPIEGVVLDNIRILMQGGREKKLHSDPPYPFPLWGHRQSPYDIYCRYVNDLKIRNVQLTWASPEKPEWGSAIRCRDVRDLEIDGFVGRQAHGSEAPAISLRDTRKAFIHNSRAPEGSGVFVKLEQGSEHVTLMNNELSAARKMAERAPGVAAGELFEAANRPPSR